MQPLGASGDISDLDPGSQNAEQMTEEMEQIDREMRFLADQEALLEKSQQLREKRLALQQMRQKVSKLRGMDSHSESILKHKVVSKTTNKPVKKTKTPLEPKTRVPLEPRVIIYSSASARTLQIRYLRYQKRNVSPIISIKIN